MFEIVRRLKTSRQAEALPRNSGDLDGSAVKLLAVTQDPDAWHSLRDIADRLGWMLFWAPSCDKAVKLLDHYGMPLVICDRDLPGEDWRKVIQRIGSSKRRVCVLLASTVCDDFLWKEVTQHGGFDVLLKPFDAERVARTVKFAWSWRGWSHETRANQLKVEST